MEGQQRTLVTMARSERGMTADLMDEACRALKGGAENEVGVRTDLSVPLPAVACRCFACPAGQRFACCQTGQ